MCTRKSINGKDENVNMQYAIRVFSRLFYLYSTNKNHIINNEDIEDALLGRIELPYGDDYVRNCPMGVPKSLAPNNVAKEKKEIIRKAPQEKFPELHEELTKGEVSVRALKKALKQWIKKLFNICVKDGNIYHFFECNAKGTPRYNKRNYWQIHDFCAYLDQLGWRCYFITATCKYEKGKDSIIEKTQEFKKQLNNTLKQLRKKFPCAYVSVSEAFESGYPHAHIILYVKDFLEDDKRKYLPSKKYSVLVGGRLKETFDRNFTIGFTEIVRNTKEKSADYLCKYIDKSGMISLKELANKKKWTKTDRKTALTILVPIMSGTRQFSKSVSVPNEKGEFVKYERIAEEKEIAKNNDEYILKQAISLSDKDLLKWAGSASYLITLCNNLPDCLKKEVWMITNETLEKVSGATVKTIDKCSDEIKEKTMKSGHCLTCSGCIMSHFLRFLLTGDDEWYGNSKYHKEIEHSNNDLLEINNNLDKHLGIAQPEEESYTDVITKKIAVCAKGWNWEQKKETFYNTQKYDVRVTPFMCKEYDEVNIIYDKTAEINLKKEKGARKEKLFNGLGKCSELKSIISSKNTPDWVRDECIKEIQATRAELGLENKEKKKCLA